VGGYAAGGGTKVEGQGHSLTKESLIWNNCPKARSFTVRRTILLISPQEDLSEPVFSVKEKFALTVDYPKPEPLENTARGHV
jgi:hypothetical protein